jgi:hypothetical protein
VYIAWVQSFRVAIVHISLTVIMLTQHESYPNENVFLSENTSTLKKMLSSRSSITYFSSRMRQATAIDYYYLTCFSIDNSEFHHANSGADSSICLKPLKSVPLYLRTSLPRLRPNLDTAIRMQALARNKATIRTC